MNNVLRRFYVTVHKLQSITITAAELRSMFRLRVELIINHSDEFYGSGARKILNEMKYSERQVLEKNGADNFYTCSVN